MLIVPKEKPLLENLNSYYLDISRLLEHYQGELVSGVFHFRSTSSEGAIFFENNVVLEGIYSNKNIDYAGNTFTLP